MTDQITMTHHFAPRVVRGTQWPWTSSTYDAGTDLDEARERALDVWAKFGRSGDRLTLEQGGKIVFSRGSKGPAQ